MSKQLKVLFFGVEKYFSTNCFIIIKQLRPFSEISIPENSSVNFSVSLWGF